MPLLKIRSLVKEYRIPEGLFSHRLARAVDHVDLSVDVGDTIGIVGESGCGKTTLARCVMRIVEPTSGQVIFDDEDLLKLDSSQLREKRKEMAIVYQNPYLSLSPRLSVQNLVGEPLETHSKLRGERLLDAVVENLDAVGLSTDHLNKRARELSGGQAQRVAIARALTLRPKLVVLDEPTSALDVSVQAQVLNLLVKLRQEQNLTYLFISHNLDVVQHLADRIVIMYLGRVVELGNRDQIFNAPRHPYTISLLGSTPQVTPQKMASPMILEGSVPSLTNPPVACHFHPRCPIAQERCKLETPTLRTLSDGRLVRCHFPKDLQ